MHARSFSAETGAAADGEHPGDKLHPDHPPGHLAKILPKRQFELGNTAACGFGTKRTQQEARHEGSAHDQREASRQEGFQRCVGQRDQGGTIQPVNAKLECHRACPRSQTIEAGQDNNAGAGRQFLKLGNEPSASHPASFPQRPLQFNCEHGPGKRMGQAKSQLAG